jgi:small acid-soluble spore protein P (minor)
MPKNIPQPVNSPEDQNNDNQREHAGGQPEPLSGSKKVKNRNHSRQAHAGRN